MRMRGVPVVLIAAVIGGAGLTACGGTGSTPADAGSAPASGGSVTAVATAGGSVRACLDAGHFGAGHFGAGHFGSPAHTGPEATGQVLRARDECLRFRGVGELHGARRRR